MNTSIIINPIVDGFIEGLRKKFPNLWWPQYLFHYTDILNILKILGDGHLLSRNDAKNKKLLKVDSAGQDILAGTDSSFFDYARLYFRPQTPPLWRVEGFKSKRDFISVDNPHCPMPIYMVFYSKKVLSLPDIQFSDKNLASPKSICYDSINDLDKLDFSLIYHNHSIHTNTPDEKDAIIKSRCAEVIIPHLLCLEDNLGWIVCRSQAERETLINLMSPSLRKRYANCIKTSSACFHVNRFYVKEVNLQDNKISFKYSIAANQFNFQYVYETDMGAREKNTNYPIHAFVLKKPKDSYSITLYLDNDTDNHIAYLGRYQKSKIPFR